MVQLSQLPKTVAKKKRRKGQGYGSGRGKTAGRGTKGQKARGSIPPRIKLAGTSFVKRLPLFRGRGRNKRISTKPVTLNLKDLKEISKNTVVDLDYLVSQKLVKREEAEMFGVKILGDGQIKVPATFRLKVSGGARKKITAAKGKVEKPHK